MSNVVIQECQDYGLDKVMSKINEGVEIIGGWNSFVQPGSTVLLKVNLIGPKPSDSAAVTHCEFVRSMVRILKQRGCTVWIGDSSGGAIAGIAPTARSFKVAGYEKIATEEGAIIKNFDCEGVVEVCPQSRCEEKMYLARPIFDADVVINLPKLKTHSMGIYTGAVKNSFGCIPGLRKAKYHKIAPNAKEFGEIIADINQAAKFHLHIMDGIISMEGEGPTAGEAYPGGKILISTDPLALDVVAMKMLGLDIQDVPILEAAQKRGIGEVDLENILIDGDYKTIPKLENYKLPKGFRSTKKSNSQLLSRVIDFFQTRPKVNLKKCKNCNICVESCPVEAINIDSKNIDYQQCIECLCCHELCIYKAVDLKKENFLASIVSRIFMGRNQ
ncbi:MAG: DUF362 domain-containing protein [Bacillota bacterium]|nr:DUF362 domain-containing protein [Bacillota bacterium]